MVWLKWWNQEKSEWSLEKFETMFYRNLKATLVSFALLFLSYYYSTILDKFLSSFLTNILNGFLKDEIVDLAHYEFTSF